MQATAAEGPPAALRCFLLSCRPLVARELLDGEAAASGALARLDAGVRGLLLRLVLLRYGEVHGALATPPFLDVLAEEARELPAGSPERCLFPRLAEHAREVDRRHGTQCFSLESSVPRAPSSPPARDHGLPLTNSLTGRMLSELAELDLSSLRPEDLGALNEANLSWELGLRGRRIELRPRRGARRRRGAFYTPPPVARDILRRTLGRRLFGREDGKPGPPPHPGGSWARPGEVADLRLLDPSCGAGAFLAAAFDMLAVFYRAWDVAPLEPILTRHLYGLDLDIEAVHLATSILALKSLLLGRAPDARGAELPSPGGWNLRVGDALYPGWGRCRPRGAGPLKPFIWQEEFPRAGDGFDFVVGNPPYVSNRSLSPAQKEHLAREYETPRGRYDLAVPFTEAGLRLLRPGGELGYLTSNKFLAADYGAELRRLILERYRLSELVDLSLQPLFEGAASYPVIAVVARPHPSPREGEGLVRTSFCSHSSQAIESEESTLIPLEAFRRLPGSIITARLREETLHLPELIQRRGIPLPAPLIRCGIARAGFSRRLLSEREYAALPPLKRREHRRLLRTTDVVPFLLRAGPVMYAHRSAATAEHWKSMAAPKLLVGGIGRRLRAAVETEGAVLGRIYYVREDEAGEDLHFLAALLNSRVMNWYFALLYWSTHLAGGYLRMNSTYLSRLPLARPALLGGEEREIGERLALLARELGGGRAAAGAWDTRGPCRRTPRKGEVDPRPGELDLLVARLYGLGPDDYRLLEEDLQRWQG